MNRRVLERLDAQLPAKIKAARTAGLDCVRVTVEEAQVIRAVLPGLLKRAKEEGRG